MKPDPAWNIVRNFFMFMALVILINMFLIRYCSAQDGRTALALVQCVRAECGRCDRHPEEQNAMAWILRKGSIRRRVSMYAQIVSYCAAFNKHNERARSITESTFEVQTWGSPAWWSKMRAWALRFLNGEIADPVPDSRHWGGSMDVWRMRGRTLLRSYCSGGHKLCTHIWR